VTHYAVIHVTPTGEKELARYPSATEAELFRLFATPATSEYVVRPVEGAA
jgi:hypothetical protein